jgi:FecR protein
MTKTACTLILLFVCALARAQAADPSAWLAQENIRLVNEVNRLKAQESTLQEAIAQSMAAQSYAKQKHNTEAEALAGKAISDGQNGLAQTQAELARTRAAQQAFQHALEWKLQGRNAAGVPAMISGVVTKSTAHGPVPLDPAAPLRAGDTIHTDLHSSIDVYFRDGSRVRLSGNTTFTFVEDNPGGPVYQLLNGLIDFKHVSDSFQRRAVVRTPAGPCAVRGTEFQLEANFAGFTTLKLISGAVDLSAEKNVNLQKFPRWWEKEIAATLPDGTRLWTSAGSEATTDKDEKGSAITVLNSGHFHLRGSTSGATPARPTIQAGGNSIILDQGEIDVTVQNGVAEIIPLAGTTKVRANAQSTN